MSLMDFNQTLISQIEQKMVLAFDTMDLKQISPSDGATAQDDSKWPEFYSLL